MTETGRLASNMAHSNPRFTLYMSGTSYYAEKVIPVLDDRGKFISESDDIIDYLDTEIIREPRLVPDPNTVLGQEVARFRKLLDVNVGLLSFGVAYNPDLAPAGRARMSRAEQDVIIDDKITLLEKIALENPDLTDAYLAKIPPLQRLQKDRKNPDAVQGVMRDLQTTLDEVDAVTVKSKRATIGETWLLGRDFTAADISLAVLLRRLSLLGLSSLYLTESTRPGLCGYWQRLQTDPTFLTLSSINIDFLYVVDQNLSSN